MKRYKVPTGDICIIDGERAARLKEAGLELNGSLEFLSLQDYGAGANLNQNKPVPDGLPLLPLTKKWVVTISTQYGCSMGCHMCDVPKVGPGVNCSLEDLKLQVKAALDLHPEVTATDRLNIHYARMGEPTWNENVLAHAYWIYLKYHEKMNPHPVVSTMLPRNNQNLEYFLKTWLEIKNLVFRGNAGLQLSINSTDEKERLEMFGRNSLTLKEAGELMQRLPNPVGRKITLNFAVADYTVDPEVLLRHFDPECFICKLTPMHMTKTALQNGIKTEGDYTTPEPYMEVRDSLLEAGYEVLVFIASHDEDAGRITCGNAILSGSLPHKYEFS